MFTIVAIVLFLSVTLYRGADKPVPFHVLESSDSTLLAVDTLASHGIVKMYFKTSRFEPRKHKLRYRWPHRPPVVNGYSNDLLLIDGRHYFGTDLDIPADQLDTLQIWLNNKPITIPKKRYEMFYNFGTWEKMYAWSDSKHRIHISKIASDGAGTYNVEFIFTRTGLINIIAENTED